MGSGNDLFAMLSQKDDSQYFKIDDPNADPVTVDEVLSKIPFGYFHKVMILVYFILYLSTSVLAYNFAFFLLP
jgi:MFS family permease